MATKQVEIVKVRHWFITPIHKCLCGDSENNEYLYGLKVDAIRANPTKTQWKVKVGDKIYLIDRAEMDGYFVKNHLEKTLDFLNNFKT
jgi:hypothetical protein